MPETDEKSVEYTFELMRNDPQHWSSAYDYRILENVIHVKYHDNQKVEDIFKEMQNKNENVAVKETSFNTDYYNSIKVTTDVTFFSKSISLS